MTKDEKLGYWLMLSEYDIETIPVLIEGKRWVYVAYLCQQAVERLLKGMYMYYTQAEAPKTHNVSFLFTKIQNCEKWKQIPDFARFDSGKEAVEDFLIDLMFYYMSDYPFSYKNIVNRFVNEQIARSLYEKTKETLAWLRAFQPSVKPAPLPG